MIGSVVFGNIGPAYRVPGRELGAVFAEELGEGSPE